MFEKIGRARLGLGYYGGLGIGRKCWSDFGKRVKVLELIWGRVKVLERIWKKVESVGANLEKG